MSESKEYKDMAPEDAASAIQRTAEFLTGGAKVTEGGRVELTDTQLEYVRLEKVTNELRAKAKELLKFPDGIEPKAIVEQLSKYRGPTDEALREFIMKASGIR